MKRGNKSGSISKMSGSRRRPYVVREGISGLQKTVDYGETLEEAEKILNQFNDVFFNRFLKAKYFSEDVTEEELVDEILKKNQAQKNDFEILFQSSLGHSRASFYENNLECETSGRHYENYSFEQIYTFWKEKNWENYGKASHQSFLASYKHCKSLNDMIFMEISLTDLQKTIDSCGRGHATQLGIRNFVGHLEQYFIDEWGDDCRFRKNSQDLVLLGTIKRKKSIFSAEELEELLYHSQIEWVDSVLFLIYTGWHLSDLMALTVEDVDLFGEELTRPSDGGITAIHPDVRCLLQRRLESLKAFEGDLEGDFVFRTMFGKPLCESSYRFLWKKVMETLGMNHTPIDCKRTYQHLSALYGKNLMDRETVR